MRFALRRGASAPPDESSPAAPPGPDGGLPAGPAARFAEMFDGHLLWVAVAAQPGRLGLRRVSTGEVVDVPTAPVTDQPAHLGARLDLSVLDGEEGRYDVVLERPGSDDPEVLVTAPRTPAAVRPSLDGRTRYAVVRSPEGTLRVRASLRPAGATLSAVRLLPEGIELTLRDAGPALAILAEDSSDHPRGPDERPVLVSWPVDERGVALITPASVADLGAVSEPAVTGSPGDWRPVRRHANDLADPRAGAPLPQLDHPDGGRPRLRLPWSREGVLQVRVFDLKDDPHEAGAGPA